MYHIMHDPHGWLTYILMLMLFLHVLHHRA